MAGHGGHREQNIQQEIAKYFLSWSAKNIDMLQEIIIYAVNYWEMRMPS